MPSTAQQEWFANRSVVLDDIENAHRAVRGSGAGARAASQQINQAYAILLCAQFQGFCRDLHTECANHFVTTAPNPDQRLMLLANLLFGRKIDRGNPNPGNIGSDFGRFDVPFWSLVDAHRPQNLIRKQALIQLNEWRNAIAHQDFTPTMLRAGRPHLTLIQIQLWRKACDGLVRSFNDVMRIPIQNLTGLIPW